MGYIGRFGVLRGFVMDVPEGRILMTPGEVAEVLRVDVKTVGRWATSGRLASLKTPGGHRRFLREEVEALLRGLGRQPDVDGGPQ
jgi:excisionase family DNA binding protein